MLRMRIWTPKLPGGWSLLTDRAPIMGILNATPDSFPDRGCWSSSDIAIERAVQMIDEGAGLIDISGESVRPNSTRASEEEEWSRVSTVFCALADQGVVCSVNTLHAATALRAVDAGVATINNVSGGCWDPQMNVVLAKIDLVYVVQRYRALPGMPGESFDRGEDLMGMLKERINARVGGTFDTRVAPEAIVIDPGLGFPFTNGQCYTAFDGLDILSPLGYPVLIGASRKRSTVVIGGDRDEQTSVITRHCAREGTWAVRVYEIWGNVRMARKGNEVGR